jgi:hypothetical protein
VIRARESVATIAPEHAGAFVGIDSLERQSTDPPASGPVKRFHVDRSEREHGNDPAFNPADVHDHSEFRFHNFPHSRFKNRFTVHVSQ